MTKLVQEFFESFDPASLLAVLQLYNKYFLKFCMMFGIKNIKRANDAFTKELTELIEKFKGKKPDADGYFIDKYKVLMNYHSLLPGYH